MSRLGASWLDRFVAITASGPTSLDLHDGGVRAETCETMKYYNYQRQEVDYYHSLARPDLKIPNLADDKSPVFLFSLITRRKKDFF